MKETKWHNEGKAKIIASFGKINSSMQVFYNPAMKLNRDISIEIAKHYKIKEGADILAGSGIRSVRLVLEGGVEKMYANDINENASRAIKINSTKNKVSKKIIISQKPATKFLEEIKTLEYIDIDPFGSPNQFLDSAIKKIGRRGILAVTATDTAPLAGTYPKTCKRKYWAAPLRNHLKHEVAIRILIRKIQLIGAQYEKALTPVYSHSTMHYYRVYLKCEKGKTKVDEIIKQHELCNYDKEKEELKTSQGEVGPIWTGKIWDEEISKSIAEKIRENMTRIISEESKIHTLGYYDIHEICSKTKRQIPPFESIIQQLVKQGYKATRTHFTPTGIRTNAPYEEMMKCLSLFSLERNRTQSELEQFRI
ncbi:hypothetical protein HY483_03740 [Candidatus Woesearchaeota archaeon]|nr:hypothetical protein [Candidatus Woesearchaeota archaeon]